MKRYAYMAAAALFALALAACRAAPPAGDLESTATTVLVEETAPVGGIASGASATAAETAIAAPAPSPIEPSATVTLTATATATAMATAPAGWQTYTDAAFGFALAHPAEWEMTQAIGLSRIFDLKRTEPTGPSLPRFYVSVLPAGLSCDGGVAYNCLASEDLQALMALPLGQSLALHPQPKYQTYTRLPDVEVGGSSGLVIENENPWPGDPRGAADRRVLVRHGIDTTMLGAYYETPAELEVFEQVLATFRFLAADAMTPVASTANRNDPDASWLVYSDARFAVSLRYPPTWRAPAEPGLSVIRSGADGFFQLTAASLDMPTAAGVCLEILDPATIAKDPRFGVAPTMQVLTVADQPACLISPSADQPQSPDQPHLSLLVVQYPEALNPHSQLHLWADKEHIRGLASTLSFIAATPSPLSGILTGTVIYRPRIAVSPDAVITVTLQDVSRADAPATVIASQTIAAQGRQVPIPFELKYDPYKLDPRALYTMRAQIMEEGRLSWTSDTMTPVLTHGAPATGVQIMLTQVMEAPTPSVTPAS